MFKLFSCLQESFSSEEKIFSSEGKTIQSIQFSFTAYEYPGVEQFTAAAN